MLTFEDRFAEVALVKVDLSRMEGLMVPNAKEQMDEDKSLADLYKQYNKVRKKHFNGEEVPAEVLIPSELYYQDDAKKDPALKISAP